MGIELLEIGVKMRKVVIFTVKGCYRSVCNHPFLVVMLCFLVLLHRSCPVLFSFLVSTSPVLVCTAVLLGTLLSYGEPNYPGIEVEEETTHEAASLKTGVPGDVNDATVVEKSESYYVERYSENGRDEPEKVNSSSGKEISREVGLDDTAPLIEERSREVELDGGDLRFEHKAESNEDSCSDGNVGEIKYAPVPNMDDDDEHLGLDGGDLRFEHKAESSEDRFSDGEVKKIKYAPVPNMDDDDDEHLRLDDDEKAETDSFDSEKVNVDSLDSPPRSPWTRIDERDEEDEENDEGSDSESGRAESSSPDASMADIMPMLDELHPLLDEDAPRPVHMSGDVSPRSRTDNGHDEADDRSDSDNNDDLDGPDDDNEDEEDVEGDKEEAAKSAITWTEEDEKNLMDLGSSEIERNTRLENLIMRRRARKTLSTFPERNLIDLESADLPFNIAPITTRRQNPFDSPHDAYDDDSGLPPIPGSAPSVLLPRRNPFDIPYDSSEEKPDLKGDSFQEEFTRNQTRDSFFRRHESFNVRPSNFASNRRGFRMRPYFVPEGMVSEESSYSAFQRQSSELSDISKVSSVPETESLGSVEDLEERKLDEEHDLQEELDVGLEMKGESEVGPSHVSELISREVIEQDKDEGSSELGQVEKENVVAIQLGGDLNFGGVEHQYSRDSSSSSLSEESERVYTVTEGNEDLSIVEEARDFVAEETEMSAQTSVESIDGQSNASTSLDEIPHMEPVYDLSPRELTKNFSSSSISSDLVVESSSIDQDEQESRLLDVASRASFEASVDVASRSSFEASVEENVVEQHLRDQVPSSWAGENTRVGEPPSEGQLTEEYSVDSNETVQSPNSDAESDKNSISASSAEENSSVTYDNAIEKRTPEHLDEVEVSNTSVESSEDFGIQDSNTPDIQELNHDISSSVNYPLSPDFLSLLSSSSDTVTSHVDVQKIVEEVDEINVIDEDFLSELDSVGDFSTSTSKTIEVNKIENKNETLLEEGEAGPTYSVVSRNYEDTIFGMAEVEARTVEETDSGFKQTISHEKIEKPVLLEPTQSDPASVTGQTQETSILELRPIEDSGEAQETSSELHVDEAFHDGITHLPPQRVVDGEPEEVKPSFDDMSLEIEADKEISSIAAEKTDHEVEAQGNSSELFVEELISRESTVLPTVEVLDNVKPIFDDVSVGNMKGEEISVIASEGAELKDEESVSEESTDSDNMSLENLEIKKDEEISSIGAEEPEDKAEALGTPSELSVTVHVPEESKIMPLGVVVDGNTEDHGEREISGSEKPELKAEDIVSRETLEDAVYDSTEHPAKQNSDDVIQEIKTDKEIGVVASEKSELQVEVRRTSSDLLVEELFPRDITNLPIEEVIDGDTEKFVKPNSEDVSLEITKNREMSVVAAENTEKMMEAKVTSSSELHIAELVPKETTYLPSEEVVDGNTENQVRSNSDDVSVEIKKDTEINAISDEEPKQKAESPQEVHSTSSVKGKGKLSKSSSSSSSSSSESSSDSDRE